MHNFHIFIARHKKGSPNCLQKIFYYTQIYWTIKWRLQYTQKINTGIIVIANTLNCENLIHAFIQIRPKPRYLFQNLMWIFYKIHTLFCNIDTQVLFLFSTEFETFKTLMIVIICKCTTCYFAWGSLWIFKMKFKNTHFNGVHIYCSNPLRYTFIQNNTPPIIYMF